jgi:transcriptional regulator with XRE-family HTH domain
MSPIRRKRPTYRRTFIREWRKHRDLSLEQLGEKLQMTASHLSMLERGQRGYTQETLEAIAEAVGTDPASLLVRDPSASDDIWTVWEKASPSQRKLIVDIAQVIVRRDD